MTAEFWYRDRFERFPPFFQVDFKQQTAVVSPPVCEADVAAAAAGASCKVRITPSSAVVIDGEQVTLTGSVSGAAAPLAQAWSFTAPSGTSQDPAPDVTFEPADQLITQAAPHWFARPDIHCEPPNGNVTVPQALLNSRYTILLDVSTSDGTSARGKADITVEAPWGTRLEFSVQDKQTGKLAAGATPLPDVRADFTPEFIPSPNSNQGTWRINFSTLAITRIEKPIQYGKRLASSSRFYEKIHRHEENHRRYIYEPGQPGYSFWTEEGLRAYLQSCTDDGSCVAYGTNVEPTKLGVKVRRAVLTWSRKESERWNRLGRKQSEAEAYRESDGISPQYLFQNCGRF